MMMLTNELFEQLCFFVSRVAPALLLPLLLSYARCVVTVFLPTNQPPQNRIHQDGTRLCKGHFIITLVFQWPSKQTKIKQEHFTQSTKEKKLNSYAARIEIGKPFPRKEKEGKRYSSPMPVVPTVLSSSVCCPLRNANEKTAKSIHFVCFPSSLWFPNLVLSLISVEKDTCVPH